MKLMKILSEMPTFHKQGKTVVSDKGIELKKMTDADVPKNMLLYVEKNGNLFMSKGWFIAYFSSIENYGSTMSRDSGWLFFPQKINFTSSPIVDIWKGVEKAGGQADKIIAAVQGWVHEDKKTVYINMLSTKPGWKRNSVATKLINGLKENWKGYKFTISKTTSDGERFFKSRPDSDEFNRDDRDYNAMG